MLYAGAAHYLTLDMTVSVFLFMGIGALLIAQQQREVSPKGVRNWMLLGYAALAAAVLTKGLIGVVLPGAALVFYSMWQRDWTIWRHLHLVKGSALLLLLTVPWFVLVSRANSEFAWFFFVHEHLERYATPISQHPGAPWYFLVIFAVGMVPWTGTATASIFRPEFSWRRGNGEWNAERFLWVYFVFILLFFSVGESKLPAYILPIFPAVSVLAARRMAAGRTSAAEPWIMWAEAAMLVIAGVIITRFATDRIPSDLLLGYQPWLIAAGLLMAIGGVIAIVGRRHQRIAAAGAGLFAILACQTALWGYQAITPSKSGLDIAKTIDAYDPTHSVPVYMINNYSPSLPFYLRRLVTMVVYKGELQLGIDAEPEKSIPTAAAFARKWRDETRAIAVFRNDNIDWYEKEFDLPMTVLKRGPRRTVVARTPAAAGGQP